MTVGSTTPSRTRRRAWLLTAAVAFAAFAAIASFRWGYASALSGMSGPQGLLLSVFGTVGYTAVGASILWRRPGNGIGRLALAIGLAFSASAALSSISAALTPTGFGWPILPGRASLVVTIAVAASEALMAGALLIGTILLIAWFPSGRRSSRLGLIVEALVAVAIAAAVVLTLQDPILRAVGWTPLLGAILDASDVVAIASLLGGWVLAILDLLRRYRRASTLEQTQMRWVVASVVLSAVLLIAVILYSETLAGLWDLWILSTTLPVFAIAVAITRYHLYDIDRIVSRSIGYAVVTAVLFATFFAVTVGLQRVLGDVVGESPIVVAASTLVVAALFQPLRTRVQRTVDRRFHRARYDAERTVAGFSGRLRDELDLPTLAAELRRTTAEAVEPSTTTVWLRAPGR